MSRFLGIIPVLVAVLLLPFSAFAEEKGETSFDRIMRTGTIRCGYVVYPPIIMKDLKTEQLSGIMYDLTEEIGKQLHLKIDWAEEVTFGNMLEGLATKRYDMLCIDGWNITMNAKIAEISTPLFYSVINAFVREGDTRFDNNLAAVNDPGVKVSSIDGTIPSMIVRARFPKAALFDMPNTMDYSLIVTNVITGKADITFMENAYALPFMEKNPGKMRMVKLSAPIQYYANSLLLPLGDSKLKGMIDTVLGDLLGSGYIENLLKKYKATDNYLPLARPYAESW